MQIRLQADEICHLTNLMEHVSETGEDQQVFDRTHQSSVTELGGFFDEIRYGNIPSKNSDEFLSHLASLD